MSYTLNLVDVNGVLITNVGGHADNDGWNGSNSTLINLTIGDSVISTQPDAAFYGCANLETVIIGNSVETIGMQCFRDCPKLTSVTIGTSVTSIGILAFLNCTSLTTIINLSSIDLTTQMGFTQSQLDSVISNTSSASGDPFVTPMLQ